ncbi:MAG: NADPH:quinone oxidoreductase family protein [Rhodospirillales bacterium]|nr:NADPH:quinone oxidoreductase family protein [Rhodospirillales bacterium]
MRAALCREWGGPEKLSIEDIPAPELRPGCVRIRVAAASVNFADTVMIQGRYQGQRALPCCPGLELAGTVMEVGEGVGGFEVGDAVLATVEGGAYAEEAVAEARFTWKIPDGVDMTTAAGFAVAYGTSHLALTDRAGLQDGETLLVHGAAGGVGLTAVEIGKRLGATVIATAGSDAKLELAGEYGADHLINYETDDVRARVKELTGGRGADVIYDPVGGPAFDASLRCVAWNGRIIIIGFASGAIPQIPANILLVKHVGVLGFYWGSYKKHRPDLLRRSVEDLLAWHGEGALRPRISMTFDLKDAGAALEALLARKSTGKVIITMEA